MNSIYKLIIFGLTLLGLTASAYAQSPRDQLQQMVEQLQKTPDDNALRERIIKLGAAIKPAPALPPEAERRMARGGAAFSGATSVADYRAAAKEFEQAALAAPWYGDAYYNLGVAQDKAEDYDAALRSLKLAALASPDSRAAEKLSYAVEFRKEKAAKANSPEARAATQAKRFEGNWYRDIVNNNTGDRARLTFTVRRDAGDVWRIESSHYTDTNNLRDVQFAGSELRFKYDITLQRANRIEALAGFQATATVTPDGNTLRIATTPLPWTSSQAAYWNSGWIKYFPGASVDEYKK